LFCRATNLPVAKTTQDFIDLADNVYEKGAIGKKAAFGSVQFQFIDIIGFLRKPDKGKPHRKGGTQSR